jgi:predicted phosphodiesterase
MRIAVVADIHGNRTAFEAVLADLRLTSPDVVLHGGDLADGGSSPVEIVDAIRDLGWAGVVGNTDEMLARSESLEEFADGLPQMATLFAAIREMAAVTREALGEERLAWMWELPRSLSRGAMTLVHASPESPWRAPGPEASDEELESVYGLVDGPVVVYGHIHRGYMRQVAGKTIVNTGSVGLSYDGDRRASYLLLDDLMPEIRRVEYDVGKELKALSCCGLPHAEWVAKMLRSASAQMPSG